MSGPTHIYQVIQDHLVRRVNEWEGQRALSFIQAQQRRGGGQAQRDAAPVRSIPDGNHGDNKTLARMAETGGVQ